VTSILDLPFTEARAKVSPAEYVAESRRAIGKSNGALNAFLRVSDAANGAFPIAIKDNIVTTEMPTTCASRILEGFISPFDATVIQRLRANGAAIMGKTNLDEFAMGSSTEHSAFGATRNPWDATRVAGGSSGGSAAAVAARMVPAALGSDTGGSVRQPAALCGIVGVKPTYGRVSRYGLVAFGSSLDQIGTLTKTVREGAELLRVIAGHDPLDSTSSPREVDDYPADCDRGVRDLRVGVISEGLDKLSEETRKNFDAAVDVLRRGGAKIADVHIPSIPHSIAIYYVVANAEASANLSRFDGIRYGLRSNDGRGRQSLHELYFASRGAGFGPEVKRRIMLGTFALSSGYYDAYYGRAQRVRQQLRSEFDAAFHDYDVLLSPTSPEPAFRLGEKIDDPLTMYLNDIFTAPANLAGLPAMSIPSGFTATGLPLALQVTAPHFGERVMFRAASYFENETGYWKRTPGLC
jgi:aspartyl-tRNA(Asn)/glutamyl-tRNA(Gln) amidotransferase subunit A